MGDDTRSALSRRRWSPVTRTLWTDDRFCRLSSSAPSAQTLWLYLLTGPEQGLIPGLFVSGIGSLGDRLSALDERWTYDEVRRCLGELRDAGMLRICARPPLFWLPNAHRHHPHPNPNQIIAWRAAYDELPECPLRDEALSACGAALTGKTREAFAAMFPGLLGAAQGSQVAIPGTLTQTPPQTLTAPKSKSKSKKETTGSEAGRLAGLLLEGIASHLPEHRQRVKARHVATWAGDIDKLIRIDGADPATVEAIIRLVHVQGHPSVTFWRANILSGKKLRERFTQVLAQAREAGALRAAGTPGTPWHSRHAQALKRLRDRLEQRGHSVTPEAVVRAAPDTDKPTTEQAAQAVEWIRQRKAR